MFLVTLLITLPGLLNITYSTYLCFTLLMSRVLKWVNRGYMEKWIHVVKMMILFETMVINYWIYLLFWHSTSIHYIEYLEQNRNHIWSWNLLYILLPFAIIRILWNILFNTIDWFYYIFVNIFDRMLPISDFHVCNANCTSNCLSSLWNVMCV
jgi:hypothetical protein